MSALHPYHKIQTAWLRDPATKHKTLLEGQWAKPEFELLRDSSWFCTEKVDGTNIRLFIGDDWPVALHGRTDRANLPPSLVPALEEARERLSGVLDGRYICYGEGYGAGIQKGGGNYGSGQYFALFDIAAVRPDGLLYLERQNVEDIAGSAGVEVVPLHDQCSLSEAIALVEEGFDSAWGPFRAEGLICTPAAPLFNRYGERVITKIKCKDFAAKGASQ